MTVRRVQCALWVFMLAFAAAPAGTAEEIGRHPGTPQRAAPQEGLTSVRRIPGLSVDPATFPGRATVLTAEDIRRSGASTIQEALARAAGVTIADQQGFGLSSDGTVNLRGIVNSSRTNALVLVDGIRQNRLTGDEVHWQAIPVDQVERIEILPGGGGLIYGEGALAGLINIATKQSSARALESEEGVEVGSFGWQKYFISARGRVEPLRYGVNYTRRLVDGYREWSWSRNTTTTAHVGLDFVPSLSADVHVLHSEDTTAFPGLITRNQTEQRRRQANSFHGFNSNELDQVSLDMIAGPWDGWSGLLTLFWKRWGQTSEDSINFNSFTMTPSRGLNFRTNHEWSGTVLHNVFVNGIELSEDKATTGDRDAFPGPDSESTRHGYGLYFEDTLTLWERCSLVGGVRLDKSRYEESLSFPDFTGTLRFEGWSPRVGLAYTLVPETLHLFTSYARPFKAPNVDDFSSRLSSIARSNADLKPQQADAYEAGATFTRASTSAGATVFSTRIDDEILYNNLALTNQNFDTKRVGVELTARTELLDHRVHLDAHYTFVDATFHKGQFDGRTIPGTPEHTFVANVGVSPVPGLWVDLDWRLVQDFFRTNDMDNRLGGADNYGVLDLRCRYALSPRRHATRWPQLSAYAKIENITNAEYVTYQSSNSVDLTGSGEAPMPPTTFLGGITMSF